MTGWCISPLESSVCLPRRRSCNGLATCARWVPAITAVAWALAIGAIYEVFEWRIAMAFAPAYAEAYNGQQGDIWDPQKDLALAWLGATIAACFVLRKTLRSSDSN